MSHDPLTLAYMAGVIDSDGFITIQESTRRGRRYYAAVIGVSGTRRQPHDLAASLWGGNVRSYEPENPRHRLQYQWSRSGEAAAVAITDVLPFLRIKEEQAWLALDAQEIVRFAGSGLEDPFPWFGPDYDHSAHLADLRAEMVGVLNQGRHLGDRWNPTKEV